MFTNSVDYSDMFNTATIDGDVTSANAIINNLQVSNISSLLSPSPIIFDDNIDCSLVIRNLQGNATSATTAISFTDPLIGDVMDTQNATIIPSNTITNAMLAASIDNSKLLTLTTSGLVANSATTATSSNTDNTIVLRDGGGGFSMGGLNTTGVICTANASEQGNIQIYSGNSSNYSSFQLCRASLDFEIGDVANDGNFDVDAVSGDIVLRNYNNPNTLRFAIGSRNPQSQLVLSSSALTMNGIELVGDVIGSATSFTGTLLGDVSGVMSSTVINNGVVTDAMLAGNIDNSKLLTLSTPGLVANSATTATTLLTANSICQRNALGNIQANYFDGSLTSGTVASIPNATITDAMLAGSIDNSKLLTLTAAGLVANSATTATASNTTGTIALRDDTNGTQFRPINTGNIRLTNITSNSPAYIYGTNSGSGVNLTYNVNASGAVQNAAEGTGNLILSNEFVSLGAGATNTAPTTYLRIESGGVIQTQNSGKFQGNLQSSTLTRCVINSTTNTVTADTLRVLFASPLAPQTLSVANTWVNLSGYSVTTGNATYNVIFNLMIQLPASYSGNISIAIYGPSISTTLTNPFINSSAAGSNTICFAGSVQVSTISSGSTIYLQASQSIASSIVFFGGYMMCTPYT